MSWKKVKSPSELEIDGKSWFFDMTGGFENEKYFVLYRDYNDKVKHIAICRKDKKIVTWSEKQRIKDELFGEDMVGIEIYPKKNDLIDDANVYHIWISGDFESFALK